MNISFNILKLNNEINFSGSEKSDKKVINSLYEIPDLTCAKCGRKMLTVPECDELYDSMRVSTKDFLEEPFIKVFSDTNIYKKLKQAAEKNPNAGIQNLVNIEDFSDDDKKMFSFMSGVWKKSIKPSKEAIAVFESLSPYLSEKEKAVLAVLKKYAKKYPDCRFSEIFNKPEVITKHILARHVQLHEHRNSVYALFENVRNNLSSLSENANSEFDNLKERAFIISYRKKPAEVKRYLIGELIQEFLKNNQLSDNDAKYLLGIKDVIPLLDSSVDSVLAKFHDKRDTAILRSLLSNFSSSFAKILPQDNPKKRVWGNGIQCCSRCGKLQEEMSFPVLANIYPDFAKNIQRQLNKIISYIVSDNLSDCKTYPQQLQKTVLSASNGRIKLNLNAYFRALKEKNAAQKAPLLLDSSGHKLQNMPEYAIIMSKKESIAQMRDAIKRIESYIQLLKVAKIIDAKELERSENLKKIYRLKIAQELDNSSKMF